MAGGGTNNDGPISDINMTPLVDIMLVLVIILMVTGEFSNKARLREIDLPKVYSGVTKQERKKVAITITPDNRIWFQESAISIDALEAKLKARKKVTPELIVILRAEGGTSYKDVMKTLNIIKSAGVSNVSLAVNSEPKRKQEVVQ